ncbi:MAG: amylo-alpha-1,6-glucosidase [Candidatus Nanohalobium sp.]
MEYRFREQSDRRGVVSNTHGFLFMDLDGGFSQKWSGYWQPSYKYLDYFASKVNGIWLNSETLEETCYSDKLTMYHSTASLKVEQKIEAPDNMPGFRSTWKLKNKTEERKAVRLSVETGIDIRPRDRDITEGEYSIESSNAGMKISKDERYIAVSGSRFTFEEEPYTREHYPGEKQVCLVPGEIVLKAELEPGETEEAEIIFKTDGSPSFSVESSESSLKNPELGRTFNCCLESMENLFYSSNGPGIIAGHPWFQNYWARDSFWTALGLVDAGMFEETRRLLQNFADRDVFPSKIRAAGGEETDYPRSDSIPLFALAVEKLDRHAEAPELKKKAEELLEENRPKEEVVKHDPEGTWMDTLERRNAVDIQSLWIEALEKYSLETGKLREGLQKFKKEEYVADNLGKDFESVNPAVSLMFNQFSQEEAEKYLEKLNGEFSSRYGTRTRSVADPGYESSGYHTGSVWGLTTCWAAAANLNYGNSDHGRNLLERMTQFLDIDQPGALPEVMDAETGRVIGCSEQAWSAGMFVHVVDSYLLGIEVERDRVVIEPAENISATRKSKKVKGTEIDMKVNNGEVEILNEPDLDIEVKN